MYRAGSATFDLQGNLLSVPTWLGLSRLTLSEALQDARNGVISKGAKIATVLKVVAVIKGKVTTDEVLLEAEAVPTPYSAVDSEDTGEAENQPVQQVVAPF